MWTACAGPLGLLLGFLNSARALNVASGAAALRGGASAAEGGLHAELPEGLQVLADQCSCSFYGLCTCNRALDFMHCMADACAHNSCNCTGANHFKQACLQMSGACHTIGLRCSDSEATCLAADYYTKSIRPGNLPDSTAAGTITRPGSVGGAAAQGEPRRVGRYRMHLDNLLRLNFKDSADMLFWLFIQALVVLGVAFCYDQVRTKTHMTMRPGRAAPGRRGFSHGLLSCFAEPLLCCFTCCCPIVRWADTMDKARGVQETPRGGSGMDQDAGDRRKGVFRYWPAVLLMLFLSFMIPLTFMVSFVGAIVALTFFRQRLRVKYKLHNGDATSVITDCLVWLCCPLCAAVQEAREVEDARRVNEMPTYK